MTAGADVFSKLNDLMGSHNNSSIIPANILSRGKKHGFEATATHVISWAMQNTAESTAAVLPNWTNQSLFFASSFGKDLQLSITEEILKLEDMYGKSFTEQTVAKMTGNAHLYHMNRTGDKEVLGNSVERMVVSIRKRVDEYG